MPNYIIRPIQETDRAWLKNFIVKRWGSDSLVGHGTVYYPAELPGFLCEHNGKRVGLVTYHMTDEACEIITVDSLHEKQGIGTLLIHAAKAKAQQCGCHRLWLITTNDNLNALHFYQKRGFVVVDVHPNAVAESRKIKPDIPEVGKYGIPIRDEIELEMELSP